MTPTSYINRASGVYIFIYTSTQSLPFATLLAVVTKLSKKDISHGKTRFS